jgi:hypothetical protein
VKLVAIESNFALQRVSGASPASVFVATMAAIEEAH